MKMIIKNIRQPCTSYKALTFKTNKNKPITIDVLFGVYDKHI